jgi:hypothetical protein
MVSKNLVALPTKPFCQSKLNAELKKKKEGNTFARASNRKCTSAQLHRKYFYKSSALELPSFPRNPSQHLMSFLYVSGSSANSFAVTAKALPTFRQWLECSIRAFFCLSVHVYFLLEALLYALPFLFYSPSTTVLGSRLTRSPLGRKSLMWQMPYTG